MTLVAECTLCKASVPRDEHQFDGHPFTCDFCTGKRVPLYRLIDQFATDHPECMIPYAVHDRCQQYAEDFTQTILASGSPAETISGFKMDGTLILQGHFATLANGYVWDWTARQFDPKAVVPTSTLLADWRETWRSL